MATRNKVLIVEADQTSAHRIKECIEHSGFEAIAIATNGMTALQAINSSDFDLAIIDLGLPDSWSETVLHALSKKPDLVSVIILGLPENGRTAPLLKKYPQAVYLAKPFANQDLLMATSHAAENNSFRITA